ncbi:MAG: HAMP domain-containing histidine kinase [Oscillospiraceae bacterium]|nr:HAMP domain-containing histidine kinase [Oscillospiraceae bacterium]
MKHKKGRSLFYASGLRKRWLINTVSIVCVLGLTCVLALLVVFSMYSYSSMESKLRHSANEATEFFANSTNQSQSAYYQAGIIYSQNFQNKNDVRLQFVDIYGQIVATSYGDASNQLPGTPDINNAIEGRTTQRYLGNDPTMGERVMAISSPVIYNNEQVVGVLRFVVASSVMDKQIAYVGIYAIITLILIIVVVLISSNYYSRSVLSPLNEIIDKAKKITGGSYGIQIQTKYNDEFGELAATINEMSLKINENEKMQTEFISSLSHELRTPLTAITGWSETLLSSENLTGDTRRGMKIIHREAGRLTEMVLELLDFTRIQDGRMTLNMELTDIRAEFEDTIYMYGSRLAQDVIALEYADTDEEIPEISCDPKRLRQVFLNILDNAAKHGSDGKRIEVSIGLENNAVVVTVRDYGPGIPEDELPLVKKKFYKGSSKARGSGIGLAVCDEIVQLHGGTLTLSNAEGGGTLVVLSLPVIQ